MNINTQKTIALKNIVNSVLEVNVNDPKKTDEIVKARAICYKIMRDECYFTLKYIADQFGKNHATIMHSLKEFPFMMKYDKRLQRAYLKIMGIWEQEADQYVELNPTQLKKRAKRLARENNLLNLSLLDVQEQLETVKKQHKRHKNIIGMIDERIPEERLQEVERKLNSILNGM